MTKQAFHSILVLSLLLLPVSVQNGFAQETASAEWKSVKGVSVPVPPAAHPRLFLTSKDLVDLKRRIAHPNLKAVWDEL